MVDVVSDKLTDSAERIAAKDFNPSQERRRWITAALGRAKGIFGSKDRGQEQMQPADVQGDKTEQERHGVESQAVPETARSLYDFGISHLQRLPEFNRNRQLVVPAPEGTSDYHSRFEANSHQVDVTESNFHSDPNNHGRLSRSLQVVSRPINAEDESTDNIVQFIIEDRGELSHYEYQDPDTYKTFDGSKVPQRNSHVAEEKIREYLSGLTSSL